MSYRYSNRPLLAALLEGADASHYNLPERVVAARQAEAELLEAPLPSDEPLIALTERLAHELVDAGVPDDLAARVSEAEQSVRVNKLVTDVLLQARELAGERLLSAVHLSRPEFYEHLRAALSETLSALRKLAPRFPDAGAELDDAGRFVEAPAARKREYEELVAAGRRHDSIRRAQGQLDMLAGGARVDDGSFSWIRNADQLWGERWAGRHMKAPRPGPAGHLAYLLWYASDPAVQPWLPTLEERDDRMQKLIDATPKPPSIGGDFVAVPGYNLR